MKKTFTSLLFLAALAPAAFGQGLIVRGGMNFANAITDPEPDSPADREYRTGLNAAVLGEFGPGPVRLLVGAGYEQKGLHITGFGGGDVRLGYLTVPVLISVGGPGGGSRPRMFLNAGVEPAFLLSSDYALDNVTFDVDNAEDFDFNLRGELGVEVPFSEYGPAAIAGLGYTYSLTDANSNDDSEWHNYAFHAFLGLKIRTL